MDYVIITLTKSRINYRIIQLIIICSFGVMSCSAPSPKEKEVNDQYSRLWTEADKKLIIDELTKTTEEVVSEIKDLTEEQWQFQERPDRWPISLIIEHLELQNELHFREISAISKTPQLLQYVPVVRDWDSYFSSYATDTTKGTARWFLQPIGRFCSKGEARQAFERVRENFINFVRDTDVDMRKHFTFRSYIEGKEVSEIKKGDVRDLHQLLLTGIAHTKRHLEQIRKIKTHPEFPNDNK